MDNVLIMTEREAMEYIRTTGIPLKLNNEIIRFRKDKRVFTFRFVTSKYEESYSAAGLEKLAGKKWGGSTLLRTCNRLNVSRAGG